MPVYSVEFTLYATAYIQADDEEEAKRIAGGMKDACIEVSGDSISDLTFDDPDLPETSFSPAMTVGDPDLDTLENAEED